MKNLKRRYVYEETYNMVMNWAKSQELRAPNRKENFPYFLEEFIKFYGGVI